MLLIFSPSLLHPFTSHPIPAPFVFCLPVPIHKIFAHPSGTSRLTLGSHVFSLTIIGSSQQAIAKVRFKTWHSFLEWQDTHTETTETGAVIVRWWVIFKRFVLYLINKNNFPKWLGWTPLLSWELDLIKSGLLLVWGDGVRGGDACPLLVPAFTGILGYGFL